MKQLRRRVGGDRSPTSEDEDGWDAGWSPRYPHEESYVVDWYARHFEAELKAHWTAQAKRRKPVLVENGQKIWAGQFTGQRDVAYNLAYLRAVAMGLTRPEVVKATEGARDNTPKWQANLLAVGATKKKLVVADKSVLSWQSASRSVGRIRVGSGQKEDLLDACEDLWLNDRMEGMVNPIYENEDGQAVSVTPMAGAAVLELPRVGVTRWELPYDPTRMYLLASDPGTASPPKRNSPVVMVWDVTEKPYELVYFHWVSGNGSYIPWLNSMKYALEKYNPHLRGIDATGPQKAIDELVFEREGIPIDSVNFARDKLGILNALKLLFQQHEMRFPYIKGMRHQIRTYKAEDKDLNQDIVAAMMVFAYLTRFLPNTLPSQKKQVTIRTPASPHRIARSRRTTRRR